MCKKHTHIKPVTCNLNLSTGLWLTIIHQPQSNTLVNAVVHMHNILFVANLKLDCTVQALENQSEMFYTSFLNVQYENSAKGIDAICVHNSTVSFELCYWIFSLNVDFNVT